MHHPYTLSSSLHSPNLYDSRDGRVLRCDCCGRIQIEFRGLALLIDAAAFENLLGTVIEVLNSLEGNEDASWRLSAPTDAGPVSATLNVEALRTLYDLLAGAQAMRTLHDQVEARAEGRRRERPPSTWR